MDDLRGKVIRGLEICLKEDANMCEIICPYFHQCGAIYENNEALMKDTLALLKAQEAIKPYIDYDGQDVWRCGKCGNSLMHPSYYESDEDAKNHIRYCSHCGQAVKWE